jgi:predicted membrane protein
MTDEGRVIVTPRLVIGAWIALMGIVLMLDRMGLVDARGFFRLWPLVIVAAGAITYFRGPQRAGRTNGVVLMVLGGWLLLRSFGVLRVGFWDLFWPLILIAAGTALVMQTLQRGGQSPASGDGDRVTVFAVMSGVRRVSTSPRFRGGDIATFLGGGRLDLRQAASPAGEEAVIDVLAVMGGLEIFVPPAWIVATPIVPFMGSVEDHRLAPLGSAADHGAASSTQTSAPRLVLRGFLLMSGVHIRS